MTATLHREDRGNIVVFTVDRPHRKNALDPPTIMALASGLQAATDDGHRAAILTAVGADSFGSGMDLHALAADRAAASAAVTALRTIMWGTERLPLIAAVNGSAVAGGFELMMRCDLAVANEAATFSLPEAKRGLLANGGSTLMPCRIPLAIALELGMTGLPITAARAYELGLVNRVVPAADVLATAIELAEAIAANAPLAVGWMRRAMWAALEGPEAGWAATLEGQAIVGQSADMHEGLAAFREKRPPVWTGR